MTRFAVDVVSVGSRVQVSGRVDLTPTFSGGGGVTSGVVLGVGLMLREANGQLRLSRDDYRDKLIRPGVPE